MNIIPKKTFIAVMLCLGIGTMAAMQPLAQLPAENQFAPLLAISNECIDPELLEKAFYQTFSLWCAQVVRQHNFTESIHWLSNAETKRALDTITSELKEHINHQISYMDSPHADFHFLDTENVFLSEHAMYIMNLFHALDYEVTRLESKRIALINLIKESHGKQMPDYFNDAQLLREAVEQELSCCTTVKHSCTLL